MTEIHFGGTSSILSIMHPQRIGSLFNTLRPRQMAAIFQTTFSNAFYMNDYVLISIKISLKFVPKGQISNIPTLV